MASPDQDSRTDIEVYVDELFSRTFHSSLVDFLFTILRVEGLHAEGWDPFEEINRAIDDINWLLKVTSEGRSPDSTLRVGLLLYCHLVEMSSAHNILMNLLRVLHGQKYSTAPLLKLYQTRKNKRFPPSATTKFREIKQAAKAIGEQKLVEIIKSFFDDNVRNAFSHSDYVITKEFFRWTESGMAQQLKRGELEDKLSICFHFYSRFLNRLEFWALAIPKANKSLFRIDESTVLELAIESERLVGFSLHFSNGQRCWYKRTDHGVDMCNILPGKEQQLTFLCGDPSFNRKGWYVRGVEIKDWDENGQALAPGPNTHSTGRQP